MIIKGMQNGKELPTTKGGLLCDRWEIYDNAYGYTEYKPKDSKTSDELRDNWEISFYYGDEIFTLKPMDYDKLFIMNDNGKTIETLRNI